MNRTVFITGATSGIGKACAEAFAGAGDDLILNGRREERLEAIKKELSDKYSVRILPLPFDVSDKNAVFDAVHNLPGEWKDIDILINNAGLALGKEPFHEAHLHDWEVMIETNVTGLLYVSKAVIPEMIRRNKGHIINISSIAGDFAYQGGNIYCASKSAVNAISSAMRTDMLPHSIKVTNIKPGAVETEFSLVRFKGDTEKADQTYIGFQPLSPLDVAQTILYCASLPEHVCINDLTITPVSQSNGVYIFKK
ncbi:MAG: SDR family NAD(P)-dependent oxidoreductase [Chitinophagaceae bacterium]|nr:SDR family NAD(P)-dependent oxidoreductase [Chitinophagaceae bacterium]